ncbi:uncharacterized protein [Amphiura filiformis]|uniref:uncharacterized protein n=1 Tax=Amphiura filiformis TaxID=82378 RepID=UPI003B227B29
MKIVGYLAGIFCMVLVTQPVNSLTNDEASWFESEELILSTSDPDFYGSVGVSFPNNAGTRTLRSNGIPDHTLGAIPSDIKPYQVSRQTFSVTFPQNPTMNDEPSCLPANSVIGFATNGVAIFSPFDENSNDLNDVDYGVNCQGRTANGGIYYYARVPDECSTFTPEYRGHDPSRIYGVAIDGFPIYGPGKEPTKITNADLDACHGKMVDGQYRYYMTDEWPYVLGCFRGTPAQVTGAPDPSDVCKFACNKDARSSDITCADDFLATTESMATESPSTTAGTRNVNSSLALLLSAIILLYAILLS